MVVKVKYFALKVYLLCGKKFIHRSQDRVLAQTKLNSTTKSLMNGLHIELYKRKK